MALTDQFSAQEIGHFGWIQPVGAVLVDRMRTAL